MTSKQILSLTGVSHKKQNSRYKGTPEKAEFSYGNTPEGDLADSIYNVQIPNASVKVIE